MRGVQAAARALGPEPLWTLPGEGAWRWPGDLWPRSGLQGPRAKSKQPGAGRSFLPTPERQVPNPGTSSDLARLFSPVGAHGGRGRPFPTMRALRGALAQGCPLWVTLPHCPPPPGDAASGPPQPPMGSQICLPRPGPGVLPGSPGLCFSAPPVGARLCRQAGLGHIDLSARRLLVEFQMETETF